MTAPGVNRRGVTPGESEYCWGQGMMPPEARGYVPTNHEVSIAIRQTDSTNGNSSHEAGFLAGPTQGTTDELGVFTPGNLRPDATPLVREIGQSSSQGQHRRVDPLKARGGDPDRYPDGLQDGSGEAWRASLPPRPVT